MARELPESIEGIAALLCGYGFAKDQIKSALNRLVEQEREACAKVVEDKARALRSEGANITADVVLDVTDKILARGAR